MRSMQYSTNLAMAPRWAGDYLSSRESLVPWPAKLTPSAFRDRAGIQVVLTANAAATGTTIAVTALTGGEFSSTPVMAAGGVAIPAGSLLDFGTNKFARTTVDALVGATAITVAALPTALVTGDRASWNPEGIKLIRSGTLLGRTYAERDASTPFGAADDDDDEIFILAFDTELRSVDPADCELYRHNRVVKENYLPDWLDISAGTASIVTFTLAPGTDAGAFRVRNLRTGGISASLAWNVSGADFQTAIRALTGDAAATVVLAAEVYTVTFSEDFSPPGLEVVNDTTNDGGVDEGGVVVDTPTEGTAPLLAKVRSLYQCIKGVD